MAVDQDIVSVCATNDKNEVEISNTDPSFKYVKCKKKKDQDFSIQFDFLDQVHLILKN